MQSIDKQGKACQTRPQDTRRKKEFSKVIIAVTGLIFLGQLACAIMWAWTGKDTSIYSYTVPSSAGVFGAAVIFYYNKAKMENVLKIKIAFLKFKIRLKNLIPPEQAEEIESELYDMENALDMKINGAFSEAVNEEITMRNF